MPKRYAKEYPYNIQNKMNANNSGRSLVQGLVPVLVIVAGLVGLYYLYQYLFGTRAMTRVALIAKTQRADTDQGKPIIIESKALPRIYEGGEFTISTWIYINNWNYRNGSNKHILSIGGNDTSSFDIIRVYLDGSKSNLKVRLHTGAPSVEGFANSSVVPGGSTGSMMSGAGSNYTGNLVKTNYDALFNGVVSAAESLTDTPICDVPSLDLQKWVHVVISVNGKAVDVYTDGRLARSCVLPNFYKVPTSGYNAKLLDKGGFGGSIATTYVYNSALNPEDVYKMYMAGPEPIDNLLDWLKSFFAPREIVKA